MSLPPEPPAYTKLVLRLFELTPMLVACIDRSGRIVHVNPSLEQAIGSSSDALIGADWLSLVAKHDERAPLTAAFGQALASEDPPPVVATLTAASGETRSIEWRLRAAQDAEDVCALCIGVDMTERVRSAASTEDALARLRESEARLSESQRIAKLGSWELDLVSGALTWSDEVFRIFGIDRTRFQASYQAFLDTVHPDDRALVDEAYATSLTTRKPYEIVHRLRMADGRIKWVQERCETSYDADGKAVRSVGTVQDITDRVLAEQAIADRDAAYHTLSERRRIEKDAIDASISAVAFASLEGKLLYANRAFLRDWGYGDEAEVVGRSVLDFWADRAGRAEVLRECLEKGGASGESIAVRKDGTNFLAQWSAAVVHDEAGNPKHLVAFFIDITKRRRAEQRLAFVFDSSPDMQVLVRAEPNGRLIMELANRAYVDFVSRVFRTTPPDVVERDRDELMRSFGLAREVIEQEVPRYRRVLQTATPDSYEVSMRCPDGSVQVEVSLHPVRDPAGTCTHVLWVGRDVTERKRTELEVMRTRDLLRSVIDSSRDWIFAKDADHRFLLVNDAFAQARGVSPSAMIARPDTDFWPADVCEGDPTRGVRGLHDDDRDAMAGKLVRNPQDVATLGDGRQRVFDTLKGPLRDSEGRTYGVLSYSRDVTEQTDLLEAQKRALKENEVLLREIHHRVKNNLQIISSLLHFHMKKARMPEERSVLEEVRKRLFAMILVHEKLYRSQRLARVELGDYARSLTGTLVQSFEGRGRISFDVVSDDVQLPIESALPAGMILCELITNVFKYAFPGARPGHATVSVQRDGERVVMRVQDDGIGLPDGFDPQTAQSFGFYLVRTLVSQLDGTLTASSDHGTHLHVAFPIPGAA